MKIKLLNKCIGSNGSYLLDRYIVSNCYGRCFFVWIECFESSRDLELIYIWIECIFLIRYVKRMIKVLKNLDWIWLFVL